MGNQFIYNIKTPINDNLGAKKTLVYQKVTKSGDAMPGTLNMSGNKIINCGDATFIADVINMKFYNK